MENVLAAHERQGRSASRGVESEREWLAQARAGDVAAFEKLYRAHVGRIYAVCLRIAGDASVAEECTQEAFITAWRKLDGFREESAFGSWLYRVATNEVMGWFRKQGRRDRHLKPVSDHEWEGFTEPASEAGTDMDLEAAIASLPDGARMVFVLHDIEGRQHDEIAELAGIAVGTSKAQLHRARRLLRERLDG